VVTTALALVVAACGDDASTSTTTAADSRPASTVPTTTFPDPVIDPGDGGDYAPELDPADFVPTVDHRWFPLTPGDRWTYEEVDEEGQIEHIEVEVLEETRDIAGITATVVRDTASIDGVVREDTRDWYAQDTDGNVWYLGEDTASYDERGVLEDHDGSFEHGVDGAYGGIVMPADPQVGDAYRQEHKPGEAEDLGQILELDGSASVPVGDFTDVIVTRDWNPLEPEVIEEKYYAPGVGVVLETHVRGAGGDAELVDTDLVG
jgi:hypothetical protein